LRLGLDNKVILITGGAGGIGTAISRGFAREGSKIAITFYNDENGAQVLAQELKSEKAEVITLPYDMSDIEQADRIVDDVVNKWGRLDVLVANAVQWPIMPKGQERLMDNDMGVWTKATRANFEGTTALIRRATQEMVMNNYGRIVVISTEIAEVGMTGATAYSAAKAGLQGVVMSLRWEVGPQGVLINLVSPGFNLTPKNLARFPEAVREEVRQRTPTGRLSSPEDVAPLVVFLGSEANMNMTGEFISVNGGAVF
jgi:3-oxoacyl-[acyl-carrier protein] reductase